MAKFVSDEHDELYHYTTGDGLAGILQSQCLHATHASYLNDAEEMKTFLDRRLPMLLDSEARLGLIELAKYPGNAKILDDNGGLEVAVTHASAGISQGIREATLAFNQPYILSFCTTKDEKIRANGLLSQWRGYGKDGGYAIVFDTKALEEMLEAEATHYFFQHVQWGDVHYHDEAPKDSLAADEIQETEKLLRAVVLAFLKEHDETKLEHNTPP